MPSTGPGFSPLPRHRNWADEEVDPLLELEVTEAACRVDPSAGWCMLIAAGSVANIGAFLPEEALDEVFPNRRVPKAASVFAPTGTATPVDGGYRLSGQWSFASGIRHSEWVTTGAWVNGGEESRRRQIRLVVPVSQVDIHDNWQVMGLRGTGSCDYSVSDLFVPERFTWDPWADKPRRGGPASLLGRPGGVVTPHCGFALGVGQLALDSAVVMGQAKERGYDGRGNPLSRREWFQRTLGQCDLRLRAARALAVETLEEAWESVCRGVHSRASPTSPDAGHRGFFQPGCRRRDTAALSPRGRRGQLPVTRVAEMPARHQRVNAAPDGQRHRLRKSRPVCLGAAWCRPYGVIVGHPGHRRLIDYP